MSKRAAPNANVVEAARYGAKIYRSLVRKGIDRCAAECVGRNAGLLRLAALNSSGAPPVSPSVASACTPATDEQPIPTGET